MADDLQVLEDGVVSAPQRPPTRPSWLLGVVGFALGLGLGVVVVGPTPAETVTTTEAAAPAEEPAPTSTTVDVETLGVNSVIPEFPDAIVAVARTTSTALDYLLWPLQGEVRTRSMTGGGDVTLDVGSRFVAMSDEVPGLEGVLLSMGRFNSVQPVASGVLSYAWHDSDSALLSFTVGSGESTGLFTVQADLSPKKVTDIAQPGARVAGWGEWGWAVQAGPDEIVLLNPDGEFKDSEPGIALATHSSGWIFAIDGGQLKLVSAGGGVKQIHADMGIGTVTGAAISPDGSKVAVAGTLGVEVLDVESQTIVHLSEAVVPSLRWSSDSRFVVAPSPGGAVVFDLDTNAAYPIFRRHTILAVGVGPLHTP